MFIFTWNCCSFPLRGVQRTSQKRTANDKQESKMAKSGSEFRLHLKYFFQTLFLTFSAVGGVLNLVERVILAFMTYQRVAGKGHLLKVRSTTILQKSTGRTNNGVLEAC